MERTLKQVWETKWAMKACVPSVAKWKTVPKLGFGCFGSLVRRVPYQLGGVVENGGTDVLYLYSSGNPCPQVYCDMPDLNCYEPLPPHGRAL